MTTSKTSFKQRYSVSSAIQAMPTDPDCYPLVPDDISFKEAMFWYIYKKMLLGGTIDVNKNGIQYHVCRPAVEVLLQSGTQRCSIPRH